MKLIQVRIRLKLCLEEIQRAGLHLLQAKKLSSITQTTRSHMLQSTAQVLKNDLPAHQTIVILTTVVNFQIVRQNLRAHFLANLTFNLQVARLVRRDLLKEQDGQSSASTSNYCS